jgi:hypothetical protein
MNLWERIKAGRPRVEVSKVEVSPSEEGGACVSLVICGAPVKLYLSAEALIALFAGCAATLKHHTDEREAAAARSQERGEAPP